MRIARYLTMGLLAASMLLAPGRAMAQESTTNDGLNNYSLSAGVVRKVLPNGLTILVKEQHEQNTVAVEIVARVGQAQEDSSNAGITDLITRMLQRQVSRDPGKDTNVVEEAGADVHVSVTPDYSELALNTTSEHVRPLFTRMLAAYKTRTYTADEMNVDRTELLADLEGEQRVFRAIYDIFLESFYRLHPYHAPQEGNPSALRLLTTGTLNAFIDRRYVPNKTVVCVVGDVQTAAMVDQITRTLGPMAAVPDAPKPIDWSPVGGEKQLTLSAGSNLAWIFLGYPAPNVKSPDYAAMRTMHALMGEGVSSRLWVDLREDHGLAYELGSIYPVLQGPGHFLAYMITTPAQLKESRQRMFDQMSRLRSEDVPEHELDHARWKVIGETLLQQETTSGKAFVLATYEAQGAGYQFTDHFLRDVAKVTPADVRRVSNKYLDNYTLIVAAPPMHN